jgi:hypothetical protein
MGLTIRGDHRRRHVLHRAATADGYRDVFVNPSDIGGRYSALSLFGMVPAAAMGLDLDRPAGWRAHDGERLPDRTVS